MKKAAILMSFFLLSICVSAQTILLPFGSTWKYKDNGSDQGTAWRGTGFNDGNWASGPAQLGYGDGDEATVVSYGNNPNKKYITTYFRQTISITNPSQYTSFTLSVKRDDGAIVYINGAEVFRTNMPAGTVNYKTKASGDAADDGNIPQNQTVAAGSLLSGNNVIAVEIHQSAQNSSDISFDLQLAGNSSQPTATLTRGPYLNMGNQSALTLRWRTDVATDSKIEAGTVYGTYTLPALNSTSTTEHEVRITGLSANTKYFYRFGSSSQVLQNGTNNYFTTSPNAATTGKIRIAAFGDCGRNDNGYQSGTLSAYQSYTGTNPAEVLLLLGDNAYNAGLDSEYQSNYFNVYSSNILKNHQLFPAPGNHDYANNTSRQADHNIPYYSIFTNPIAAECGGVASGTEAYYSWDWGNIHFLSLDSYGKENGGTTRLYDTTGAQVVWVKQDLAANTRPWVVCYWHHPPFTMGSHNSDTESELINIRQNFIRILERLGVDLILCGHSHDYERSYLLNGYYSNEASFNIATHTLSSSSGKYDGTSNSCIYALNNGANHGTVYVVTGSAGADGGIQSGYPHNALPFAIDDGGMLYFEVEDNRLDAKFIRRTGIVSDQFTIMKNVNKTTLINIVPGTPTTLTASWIGSYSWSTSENTRSITVAPLVNTSYSVADNLNCLNDIFNITITGTSRPITNLSETEWPLNWHVIPNPVHRGQIVLLHTNLPGVSEAAIIDFHGRVVRTIRFSGNLPIDTKNLGAGIYFIRINDKGRSKQQKFIVID